jgi:hypothetical protein
MSNEEKKCQGGRTSDWSTSATITMFSTTEAACILRVVEGLGLEDDGAPMPLVWEIFWCSKDETRVNGARVRQWICVRVVGCLVCEWISVNCGEDAMYLHRSLVVPATSESNQKKFPAQPIGDGHGNPKQKKTFDIQCSLLFLHNPRPPHSSNTSSADLFDHREAGDSDV